MVRRREGSGAERRLGVDGVSTGLVVSVSPAGPVAQLGARLNGIQEVTGSIPVRSTKPFFPSETVLKTGSVVPVPTSLSPSKRTLSGKKICCRRCF